MKPYDETGDEQIDEAARRGMVAEAETMPAAVVDVTAMIGRATPTIEDNRFGPGFDYGIPIKPIERPPMPEYERAPREERDPAHVAGVIVASLAFACVAAILLALTAKLILWILS